MSKGDPVSRTYVSACSPVEDGCPPRNTGSLARTSTEACGHLAFQQEASAAWSSLVYSAKNVCNEKQGRSSDLITSIYLPVFMSN